ncbi:aminotransferase class IV [Zavarzinia sp. CC-PAN008]|uniref:aminotransferase class IV n=1 Tax=Zavarzinia sp. CC-PAN008 TaxID=3243332 RepID=UPI003F7495CC
MIVWLNGMLVAAEAARIDPADRGFTLGDGLFETIRVEAGHPRHLARHLDRLRAGCAVLRLTLPKVDLGAAITGVLAANGLVEAAVRLTVSRGVAARGVLPQGSAPPTILLTAGPLPGPLPPAHLVTAQGVRRNEHSPLSRIKSLNYLDSVLARLEAAERAADDVLMLSTGGFVAEASAANLFAVVDGRLVTPPVDDGALPGTRRALLLERGAVEQRLLPADLAQAQEVFVANALTLRAVASLDGPPLPAVAGQALAWAQAQD